MARLIAIDFGTTNTLIYAKGKGIIFEEPSVVALDVNTNKVLTVGNEAHQMIGKTPTNINVINPLKYGSVDKFDIAIKMLKVMINRTREGNRFRKAFSRAEVLVGVPSSITQVEMRGIEEVIRESGARKVVLVKDVIADSVSLGRDVFKPKISFIVDMGGGTTDIAAIALGGILAEESLKLGGEDINWDIIHYIKKNYNIEIGELTAENLKRELADVLVEKEETKEVIGQDLASGLPIHLNISNREIYEAIRLTIEKISFSIKKVIEKCPPESAADILNNGIVLTGGGSLLKNIDKFLEKELGIKAHVIENPEYATINGLGMMLDEISSVKSMVLEYNPKYETSENTRDDVENKS